MDHLNTIEIVATTLFALALLHTFLASRVEHLSHAYPAHAGLFHLLGEVEVVFGLWAAALVIAITAIDSSQSAITYVESRNYNEPLLVFVLMVIAASRPLIEAAGSINDRLARLIPINPMVARFLVVMSVMPLLGSFITEPAAMTVAALLLREQFLRHDLPPWFKYAAIATLFVNISIGGALTPFAAPPVLMVAAKWDWDIGFMITQIGWRSALAVSLNALILTWIGQRWLRVLPPNIQVSDQKIHGKRVPVSVTLIHISFLATAVAFHHYPVVFMGLFLLFLGYTAAYPMYQTRLMLREALLVAFFLAGLVVLGGLQAWWLQDLLTGLTPTVLFLSATALTAITDNAAITYLGSLVEGTDAGFRYALVTGALAGGGLTVIANAPNPAGYSLLKECFPEKVIAATQLFLWALPPTLVAIAAFLLIP
jgi:hypothetical protein